MTIPKAIHEIALSDLTTLVGRVREGKTIEFKSALPNNSEKEIDSFVGGVSALANTIGGDFLIGITETKDGLAEAVTGVGVQNVNEEKRRLEHLLADWLEPRLPRIDIQPITCGEDRYVFVVRVARSWIGPHRLTKNNKFYGRNSGGKYPLDVGELRTAFVFGEAVEERIRTFRAERLVKIVAGETPVPMCTSTNVVLHMIPLPSFADRRLIEVMSNLASGHIVPLPLDGPSGANQNAVNLHGYMNFSQARPEGARSYVQLFRNGAIEGVSQINEDEGGKPYLVGRLFATKIVSAVRQYLRVLVDFDVGFPVFAFVSLCGVKDCCMKYDTGGVVETTPSLRENVIVLPEVAFDSETADVPAVLRPIFDIVWNAFGFVQSDMYTSDGIWKG
jgi:hypothetical protein